MFSILNTVEPDFFPKRLAMIEEQRKAAVETKGENIVEIRPEIMALLDAFDGLGKSNSRGSARALCMLKKGARPRKVPQHAS